MARWSSNSSNKKPKAAVKSSSSRRSPTPTYVAIIGAGRGGKALLEIFAEDPLARIVGLAEVKTQTAGTRLAQQLGVPITHDYRELLNMKQVHLVIDVTGNPIVEKALQKVHLPNLAIIGGASAKFMWQLIEARIRATSEIEKTLTRYQALFRRYVKEESEGAVDEERTRIACEIHDGLVQTLVGVSFKLERCGELIQHEPQKCFDLMQETKTQLRHGIQEARQVVFNLRPGQYEQLNLRLALTNYLKLYKAQNRVKVEFVQEGVETGLDSKTKVFLFRIVQEALNNAQKHAKATKVTVQLTIDPPSLKGIIKDNGLGFDVRSIFKDPEKWDHFGLRGMKERARLLGGDAQWESEKGVGTTITIHIPLRRKESSRNGQKY